MTDGKIVKEAVEAALEVWASPGNTHSLDTLLVKELMTRKALSDAAGKDTDE